MDIKIKKMEEKLDETDGYRIYVEGHWPKNIEREEGCIDLWLKDIAPGEGGYAWFSGKPERWGEFECGYFAELDDKVPHLVKILEKAERGPVTLLYDRGTDEYNVAVAIRDYIETHRYMLIAKAA
jgi:uncharacterized protein YeaO (DUF488 family)